MMKGSSKYRILQAELDKVGIVTTIDKQGKKQFALTINFKTQVVLKKRDSINKRLIKLHQSHFRNQ